MRGRAQRGTSEERASEERSESSCTRAERGDSQWLTHSGGAEAERAER